MPGLELTDALIPGGAMVAGIWLFYRLFVRADRRERDAFREVKEQRDYWRARAEDCEDQWFNCVHELALYHRTVGPLDDDGQ